jgi:hypothetical protein
MNRGTFRVKCKLAPFSEKAAPIRKYIKSGYAVYMISKAFTKNVQKKGRIRVRYSNL